MKVPRDPPDIGKVPNIRENREQMLEYFQRKDVMDWIVDKNQRYLYWEEITYRPKPENTEYPILWAAMKTLRNNDIEEIRLGDDDRYRFRYKIIPDFVKRLHGFDMHLGGSMMYPSIVPEDEKDRVLISSLMEEGIASSQLEGAAVTREIAKDMLRKQRKPRNRSEMMVQNNYATIKHISDTKDEKITPDSILDIHAMITRGTLENEEYEGRFRESNEIVVADRETGIVYHQPPDYREIPDLIASLIDLINRDDEPFIHPIAKASIIHFLMGYIHPFVDGNGRTARALFYWYLLSKGYWLTEYMSISRTIIQAPSKYARAYLYTEKDENDMTYFIGFQLRTLDLALKDLRSYVDGKVDEKHKVFDLLLVEGLNDRQVEIVRRLSKDPKETLTIREIQLMFNVVYQTARTDLLGLEAMGYLKKSRSGKRKWIFYRSDNFDNLLKKGAI